MNDTSDLFYIASMAHTERGHRYVTFWRPRNCGYAWPLSWAGKYTREEVTRNLTYYNNGESTVAVRVEAIDALAVAPAPRMIDGDAGPVVINNADNWRAILAVAISPPLHEARPQYRGARRMTS